MEIDNLYDDALRLLRQLISLPSFSKEEDKTAAAIEIFLQSQSIQTNRLLNNVWCVNKYFDERKPTILLNSHHDTVRPNKQYSRDPFKADIKDGKLFGLGSNDAGGCLVALFRDGAHPFARRGKVKSATQGRRSRLRTPSS